MKPLPRTVGEFIDRQHVLGLATLDPQGLWSASCFYVFDAESVGFLILSSLDTRHGAAMLAHPEVSGSISGQPQRLRDIRGLQFAARARLLQGADRDQAWDRYLARHPLARLKRAEIWRLAIDRLKFTDNALVFGHKTLWRREDG